ncbi:hypothetical protein PV325_010804 [Microctonus aethiopoides]|nr:hypothetical protein PV325_010804 [Microctonus aethiopoides]
MNRWIGKSAVVTGASSGIGEAIAKSLVNAGMNVFGLARRENRLDELSKSLNDAKGSFNYSRCDVRNENDILKAFDNVEQKFGGVDVLVNNAGLGLPGTIGDATTETFRTVLDVNVLGPAIFMREALKSMSKRKTEGHIININRDINLYSPSKYALHAMNAILRDEITGKKENIRVTGIYPGLVKTEFVDHSGHGREVYNIASYVKSEQIADCVLFALSAPSGTQVDQIVITPLHMKL